ncbi:hypothetical protein Q3G72_004552 [Acer saccharum]|nr:hypothetical protein Q3G72_004552 [Acer saccharum]
MKSLGFLFCVFSLYFAELLVYSSSSQSSQEKQVALFIIGDSLYDPGNNNFLNVTSSMKANYPPFGETFFKYPTGRVCDGRIIPDFIALHANLSLWRPYLEPGKHQFLNGANFASNGAPVLPYNNPQAVSEQLWIGGKNVTAPFNMKQLIALELDQEIVNFSDYDSTYADDE